MTFQTLFRQATGYTPFAYQRRLANACQLPAAIQVPTGSGKTAAAVLTWLWRRRYHQDLEVRTATPRRLVYCLPMRVLVEQTYRAVDGWLRNLDLSDEVGLYLLLGGRPQGRDDWVLEPEKDAVLVGTQDLLVSRALYATWRTRRPEIAEHVIAELFAALLDPPFYRLPEAIPGHRRHYMPDAKGNQTLVVDSFLRLGDVPLVTAWPQAQLNSEHENALASLTEALPYLGRAESRCEIRPASVVDVDSLDVRPVGGPPSSGDFRLERLLCPRRPLDLDGLAIRTSELHRRRLREPPGAAWVTYAVPERPPVTSARPPRSRTASDVPPTIARFVISAPALPALTDAVLVAERLRLAAMSMYGRQNAGAVSAQLSGRGPDGPLADGHMHASYLATDEDGDRLVDHLTVFAPGGLTAKDVAALASLTTLDLRDGRTPLRVQLIALGPREEVGGALARPSTVFKSHTPFVPVRHPRRRQAVGLPFGDQVELELARRGLPLPMRVSPTSQPHAPGRSLQIPWLAFRRVRVTGRGAARRPRVAGALGFRLEFEEPVRGPLSLGFGCHFGLGLFLPVR